MDENGFRDIDDQLEPESPPGRVDIKEGIPWGAVFLLIWAVLLIVFSVQNADNASVHFLGWVWEMPVALLVMVTALATLVLTGLGFAFYRRRRRRLREMKQSSRPAD
jgi:uncharacterized integral membrane protein